MRILPVSDLHLEFWPSDAKFAFHQIPKKGVDVLVIAGDLLPLCLINPYNRKAVLHFLASFPHVVIVAGNHDFYHGHSRERVLDELREFYASVPQVRFLDGEVAEVGGVRFLGTTLWFPHTPEMDKLRWQLNDYECIHDFAGWVHQEHQRSQDFLSKEMQKGDVVVTHHVPVPGAVHPKYNTPGGRKLSLFFEADCTSLIQEREPALWIYGHTHGGVSQTYANTKLICNPAGYPSESGGNYRPKLILEVSDPDETGVRTVKEV